MGVWKTIQFFIAVGSRNMMLIFEVENLRISWVETIKATNIVSCKIDIMTDAK